jgi:hypothetical protein
MLTLPWRKALFATGLAITLSFSAACGNTAEEAQPMTEVDAYSILRIEGDEVESFDSLKAMAKGADTVAVGTLKSFGVSRTIQSDAVQDSIVYGKATLQVTKQVAGKPVAAEVPVEFLLPYSPDEASRRAGEFNAAIPKGDVLVFLRAKRGPGEAGLYRLVNSEGLWTSTQRAALDAPLAEETPAQYKNDLAGTGSIAQLAEKLARG